MSVISIDKFKAEWGSECQIWIRSTALSLKMGVEVPHALSVQIGAEKPPNLTLFHTYTYTLTHSYSNNLTILKFYHFTDWLHTLLTM